MKSKEETISRLFTVLGAVEQMLATVPKGGAVQPGYGEAISKISHELEDRYQAKLGVSGGAYTIRVAGVSATCTSGVAGLLRNWRRAAIKRLDQLKAGA